MNKQKVIVYVDGFNLYYGLKKSLKWRRYYWLDVVKFFEMFMKPNQELICVKYFSAKPDNLDKALRQNAFFQANKENPKFQLFLGKYLRKNIQCYNCGYIIQTYEEKESDVRIATQIVSDVIFDTHKKIEPRHAAALWSEVLSLQSIFSPSSRTPPLPAHRLDRRGSRRRVRAW